MRRQGSIVLLAAAGAISASLGWAASESPGQLIPEAQAPQMKRGLWNGVLTTNGQAPMHSTYCDGGRPVMPPREGVCSRYEVRRTQAGAIVSDSVCRDPAGVTWTTHAVTQGDFAKAFTQDGRMSAKAPGKAPVVTTGHMVFRYMGACPPKTAPAN